MAMIEYLGGSLTLRTSEKPGNTICKCANRSNNLLFWFPHLEPSPKPTPCPVEASHLEHLDERFPKCIHLERPSNHILI